MARRMLQTMQWGRRPELMLLDIAEHHKGLGSERRRLESSDARVALAVARKLWVALALARKLLWRWLWRSMGSGSGWRLL